MSPAAEVPLTVIIPAYQRQPLLDRALYSISAQDVIPRQVIVVDDGSAPTLRLPEELGLPRVDLVRLPDNAGPAMARNAGLRRAVTEWVSFLDCDDTLIAGTLGTRWRLHLARQCRRPDRRIISGCAWIDVTSAGHPIRTRYPRPGVTPEDFASGCWFSPGSCIIMNAQAAMEQASYQDETLRRLEDVDWFLALALQGFQFEPQNCVGALIEQKRVQSPRAVADAARAIARKWRPRLPGPLHRRLRSYLQLECAAAQHFAGHRFAALTHVARSLALRPRLSLHLSPGWNFAAAQDITGQSRRS